MNFYLMCVGGGDKELVILLGCQTLKYTQGAHVSDNWSAGVSACTHVCDGFVSGVRRCWVERT
jgi:hypothetical protein